MSSNYWTAFLIRLGMNAALAVVPVVLVALEQAQTHAQATGKVSVGLLVGALLVAVKQVQSHLDLKAPAKQ